MSHSGARAVSHDVTGPSIRRAQEQSRNLRACLNGDRETFGLHRRLSHVAVLIEFDRSRQGADLFIARLAKASHD